MKIRKATKKDLDQLVEISHQLLLQQINVCQVDFNLRKDSRKIQRREFSKKLKDSKNAFFIGEEKGEIAGFITGKIEDDGPVFVENRKGHVGQFFVAERHRSRGLGKKLFAELKKWFRKKKVKTARLYVARCNAGAKRMYERLGFEPAQFEQMVLKM